MEETDRDAKLKGHCACGRVTWRSDGPILWAGHCHCDSCRRACSSSFTSFFGVPRDSVHWSGSIVTHSSSKGIERGFCEDCGAQVHYQSMRWPEETHLYAASLEDPAQFVPEAHYHWSERLPWLTIVDDLPRHGASADGAE